MTKQQQLEKEIAELRRVGGQKFSSYLDPRLVKYELPENEEAKA